MCKLSNLTVYIVGSNKDVFGRYSHSNILKTLKQLSLSILVSMFFPLVVSMINPPYIYIVSHSFQLKVWALIYCERKLSNQQRPLSFFYRMYPYQIAKYSVAWLRRNESYYGRSIIYEVSRRRFTSDADYKTTSASTIEVFPVFFSFLEQPSALQLLFGITCRLGEVFRWWITVRISKDNVEWSWTSGFDL